MDRTSTAHEQLRYSATARCRCGSGLAYNRETIGQEKMLDQAWVCAAVLLGEVPDVPEQHGKHDQFPFFMYEIKDEGQPSAEGRTTRPTEQGLIHLRIDCECPCGHKWSAPLRRPNASLVWDVGVCPACGEHGGAADCNIKKRAHDVLVLTEVPHV